MFRLPVVSSAMDARIETTLDDFHVESTEDRDALKDSLLKSLPIIQVINLTECGTTLPKLSVMLK